MASMHSQRTQCCCCAVGVFTSMFGIFMLSAGICIVLNVTFMEVDTSGLPPELHNEEGKKVVGIILICVALGTLGVSAAVAVVYFFICNRKPKPASTAQAKQQQQHSNGSIGRASRSGERTPGGETPLSVIHVGPNPRPAARSLSQSSVKPHRKPSSLPPFDRPPVRSGSPQLHGMMNSPVGVPASRYAHKSKRGRALRHSRLYKSGLDTHIEEDQDIEMARSTADVRSPQKGGEGSSQTSGSSWSAGRQNVSSAPGAPSHSPRAPPMIIVDAWTPNSLTLGGDADTAFDEPVSTTHRGRPRRHSQADTEQLSHEVPIELRTSSANSGPEKLEYSNGGFCRDSEEDEEELQAPPSLPFNIDVVPDTEHHRQNIIAVRSCGDGDDQGSALTLSDATAGDMGESAALDYAEQRPPPLQDRADSRVSYSSVVSEDGEGAADMEQLKERMRQLLQHQDSNC